jgi:hypothetical protein
MWREGVEWIHRAEVREQWQAFVNTVMNLQVSQKAEDFWTSVAAVGFSRRALLRAEGHF